MLQSKQVALLLGQVLEPTPLSPNISPISISLITTSGTPLSSCINKKYKKSQLLSTSNSSINRDIYSDSTANGGGIANNSNGGPGYGSILDDSLTDNKSNGNGNGNGNGYHSNNMKKDNSNLSGGAKSTGITSNNDILGDITNATSGSGFQELDAQAYYEDVEEYISSNVNPGENLNIVALTAVNSWKKYLSTPATTTTAATADKTGDKKANWLCVAFEGDYVLYIHTIKNNDEYLLLMTCDLLYPRGLAIKQLDALSEAFSTRL
ncbi:hypothetical protein B5S31_g4284 [[Candida] boidinii]|nr:hypothetical protein B5S31_g4284 [[Candida] boidinii]GME79485.1 unnamed protein product [[Candida] boidinii]